MIDSEHRTMRVWAARCDVCSDPFEQYSDYLDLADLWHDLKVSGWTDPDGEIVCPKCQRYRDALADTYARGFTSYDHPSYHTPTEGDTTP